MARDKDAALAPRSRSAPRVVAPRNKVNVVLPFGRITAEESMNMKVGGWIRAADRLWTRPVRLTGALVAGDR